MQQLGHCTHCVCNQSFSALLCNISCAFSLDIMQTLDRYTQLCQNYTGRDESHLGLHYVLSHLQVNTGGGHKKVNDHRHGGILNAVNIKGCYRHTGLHTIKWSQKPVLGAFLMILGTTYMPWLWLTTTAL